ncbi:MULTISPECIES: hypothetical protein [unclassified Streptomyces]|uniref:hypothetical protein n=1 Tax=unclassified Streptomyces TaxID=2593676 RepID=UPI0033A0F558
MGQRPHREVAVTEEEADGLDRRAAHQRLHVRRVPQEGVRPFGHLRSDVDVSRRLDAVHREVDAVGVMAQGSTSDTEQQPDDPGPVGGGGVVGHVEQERQARRGARVHGPLVVGFRVEVVKRLVPNLGIG